MPKLILAILLTAAPWSAACGGGGGSSGSSGPLTAPSPPGQTQAPAVNVNSGATADGAQIVWSGDVSFNEQTGTNTINFPQLTQSGSQVTGQIAFYGPDGGSGPFAGVVSGTTLTFNFSIGNQDQGCGNTISGSANVTTSTIAATFSGHRCNGKTYTNGKFTLSLPTGYSTSAYPLSGIWTATVHPLLGGGQWTFNITETALDVNGSTLNGSVAVSGGTLNLGSGALSGAVTSQFPGPFTTAHMSVTFSSACVSDLHFSLIAQQPNNPDFNNGRHMVAGITGSTCNGALPQGIGMNLFRQ